MNDYPIWLTVANSVIGAGLYLWGFRNGRKGATK